MHTIRRPLFSIWVPAYPKSAQADRGKLKHYKDSIKKAAQETIPKPTKSRMLDIEIFFKAKHSLRADVDNVLKPILDALKGIAYEDDCQICSVKATAFPSDEDKISYSISGPCKEETLLRLLKSPPTEFLINIYESRSIEASF